MHHPLAIEDHLSQLKDILGSPIVQLNPVDCTATFFDTKQVLSNSTHCCIVVGTTDTCSNKLQNLKNLYRCLSLLKHLQREFSEENPLLKANLVGIYPSLEDPACVYELHSNADRYVTGNVLPYAGSSFKSIIRHLISQLLGANPAVGGLGLTLYKE